MFAVVMRSFGPPDVLQVEEVATPTPGVGEVRVRVHAVIVARTKDVAARGGDHPFSRAIELPHVLGAEHAGIVDAVGDGVDGALVGRRVAVSAVLACGACTACVRDHEEACEGFELVGVHRPGAYAEFTTVPVGNVRRIRDEVTFVDAAALAANLPVASAQLEAGGVERDRVVVVLGAAGALGSAVAALAVFRGARVVVVDRLERKADLLGRLGAEASFDGDDPDLAARLLELTGGRGVDCVVDNLGVAELFSRYLPAVAPLGRVVVSGAIDTAPVALPLVPFYLRSQSITGVRTGNRRHIEAAWAAVESGFHLTAGSVTALPLAAAAHAHELVETRQRRGQLVLEA